MADNARGVHVSPGVYSREIDMTYAVKSLGITTLGLAGETLKGPAFQPMSITNWREFVSTFGGTSAEKFTGSQYPKYELPYVAKSYLTQSNQLEVVRVLGLSGYNAGPAWVITAKMEGDANPDIEGTQDDMVVAVLRSRADYQKYYKFNSANGTCTCPTDLYDKLVYRVGELTKGTDACKKPTLYNKNALNLAPYVSLYSTGSDCSEYNFSGNEETYSISSTNLGRFKIQGVTGETSGASYTSGASNGFEYAVSLNPNDKEYIINVLGTDPVNGDAPIYVEELYDVALERAIANTGSTHATAINSELTFYQVLYPSEFSSIEPVDGLLRKPEASLTRKDLGLRYLADKEVVGKAGFTAHIFNSGETITNEAENLAVGKIYTVAQYTDNKGSRHYVYKRYDYYDNPEDGGDYVDVLKSPGVLINGNKVTTPANTKYTLVKNLADDLYYRLNKVGDDVTFVNCDLNNYKSAYRYSSTPWIVSNLMGDYNHIELKKLFRFHTISDGNMSVNEVKVSIENIKPDEGVFDVVVRDINDTDEVQVPLEKFSRCSLIPGSKNYISYKIGSFDGMYESKSKYITVECKESDAAENAVPAGFLGYPSVQYGGTPIVDDRQSGVTAPFIKYNTTYDEDLRNRKQYFGLSSRVGVDLDLFKFKGVAAYINNPSMLTHGFHLDSRLDFDANYNPLVTVDGEKGYKFDAVSKSTRTSTLDGEPIIGDEYSMYGSIYENVSLRKFTVYFYGGFDGWDVFRTSRSNTDDFKLSKYLGKYNKTTGEGYSFDRIADPESLGLNQNGLTSDWYAYLAAIRQFSNPESVDINVFATPGIDYVNNKTLVEETIDMLEQERADSIYVVTTPDKPFGAGDYVDEMFTPEEAVFNLEESEITSNYTCTYYPWVKYLDQDNSQYIYLPPTKDVVRNFAQTDNSAYPWFAPAGLERGDVNCVKAHYVTKLADEDELYDNRINPVKTFATDGVKIWGQKNLQETDTQLNRIAVRRLLLRMRKLIAIACRSLIFEPNDSVAKNSFLSTVTPILDNIRANRGISDYKIEVDSSEEARERRELPAKIYFKPINSLEYIPIDFVLTPEGVSFDNI